MKSVWYNHWKFLKSGPVLKHLGNDEHTLVEAQKFVYSLVNGQDVLRIPHNTIKLKSDCFILDLPIPREIRKVEIIPGKEFFVEYYYSDTIDNHVVSGNVCAKILNLDDRNYKLTVKNSYIFLLKELDTGIHEKESSEILSRSCLVNSFKYLDQYIALGVFLLPFGSCFRYL